MLALDSEINRKLILENNKIKCFIVHLIQPALRQKLANMGDKTDMEK